MRLLLTRITDKWPEEAGAHVTIALLLSILFAVVAFKVTDHIEFAKLARLYPRDGQIGLGSMMVGLEASVITFIAVFLIAFFIQREVTSRRRAHRKV